MALDSADRIAFSLAEVTAAAQVAALNTAKAQVQIAITKAQALDTANSHLFAPENALINQYQLEMQNVDGNVRTVITEQDIQDSANRKSANHFFPNDINQTVPALSATHNVWTQFPPFAFTYAIGLNYVQAIPSTTTKESDLINAVLALITGASTYVDIENTSGQHAYTTGTCSLPLYTDETSCLANSGVWTPGLDVIASYPAVVTLKTNLVSAINTLVSFVNAEALTIPTNDPNSANQAQNNAALAYINGTLLPAINSWLAYPDFNPVPGSVTTYAAFYAYNSNLLAPTKLHSAQLAALQATLNNRLTFISTRLSQLSSTLGTIVQNVSDGSITSSSGLYGQRYNFLSLRIDTLTGSLTLLNGLLNTMGAQNSMIASIQRNKATYYSILPTSTLQSSGNGTATLSLTDVSFLHPGDLVYVMADNQTELTRAVKSINGNSVTLNDVVSPQYTLVANGRLYRDLT